MIKKGFQWTIFIILLLCICSAGAFGQIFFEADVIRVTDGDSITVRTGEKNFRVRLHGIDAPERNQPFGTRAGEALSGMVSQGPVRVEVTDIDRYGRLIGLIFSGPKDNMVLVNLELLRLGMAWHYTDYDDTPAFAQAEREARASRRGLWADPDPVPPWEWRRQ